MLKNSMMHTPYTLPSLPITRSTETFPVRRIFCIGQNYVAHAREMGFEPNKETDTPIFFLKDTLSLQHSGVSLPFPPATDNLHYEGELVVAIAKSVKNIKPEDANAIIFGYACGLDMTRRDIQTRCRKAGHPWDFAKAFDQGAIVGAITPKTQCANITEQTLTLRQNGVVKQSSSLGDMIWPIEEVIAMISTYEPLAAGDLIFTGTPSGVGAVSKGDTLSVQITGLDDCTTSYRSK